MKTLAESLFDKDAITNSDDIGYQLKDQVFYDGEILHRLTGVWNLAALAGVPGQPHALIMIDWKKVKADLKKYKGQNIDLGLYAHYNSDKYKIHNATTKVKTEAFARLILSIRTAEKCNFESYNHNQAFERDLCDKLNKYIVEKTLTGAPAKDSFYFKVETKHNALNVLFYNRGYYSNYELIRWEFLKLRDE